MLPARKIELQSPFVESTLVSSSSPQTTTALSYVDNGVGTKCYRCSNISMTSLKNNSSSTSSVPQTSTSIGVNLRVTGQCSQGGRKYMEDYFSVAYQQSETAKDLEYAFVGIYDGHGGVEAASFAKEHLMMEIINQKLFWSDSDHDVLRAIREGYIATHYAMWRDQDKWPKTATGLPSTAGTTATVAFIRRGKIYVGHVGDSGIVLGYQNDNENFWRSRQLTTDHKPESPDERSRIIRSGGKVVVKSGVPRVVWNRPRTAGHKGSIRRNAQVDEIPFLAVARSLGDLWSYNSSRNEFVVSPDPDVKVIKINPKTFRCLIFGTDGLWNVVTPQEAVDCVYEKEAINERLQTQRGEFLSEGSQNQWTNPSKGLVEKALKSWSAKKMRADNTSVVTVILYPAGTNIQDNTPNCHTQSCVTQVNADMLTHNDSTSYAELVDKYIPPEEYRHFSLDNDGQQEVPTEFVNSGGYLKHGNKQENINFQSALLELNHSYYQSLPLMAHQVEHIECNGENDFEVCEEVGERDYEKDDCGNNNKEITYQYNAPPSDVLNNDGISLEHEPLDYMNSFAESLVGVHSNEDAHLIGHGINTDNAHLNSNNECHQGKTSSPSLCNNNCTTSAEFRSPVIYQHNREQQHELLREHQLYQVQCMSQEEGYSLTKLETHGEQQMRSSEASALATTNGSICSASTNKETCLHLRNKEMQQGLPFKIFPHQVQMVEGDPSYTENGNMYNKIAMRKRNFWNAKTYKTFSTVGSFIIEFNNEDMLLRRTNSQRPLEKEAYNQKQGVALKSHEHLQTSRLNSPAKINEITCDKYMEGEVVSDTLMINPIDSSIQINEISSSMEPPSMEEIEEYKVSRMKVDDKDLEDQKGEKTHLMHHFSRMSNGGKNNIVLLEKIEILKDKPELVIECNAPTGNSTICKTTKKHTLPLQPPQTTRSKLLCGKSTSNSTSSTFKPSSAKPLLNASPSKRSIQFINVPNENQRLFLPPACSSRQLRQHCLSTSYTSLLQQRVDGSSRSSEHRQLRSMALPQVDYMKRTLRSRNSSLSKDMKGKTTLNLRRSTCLSNQYLLRAAAPLLMQPTVSHHRGSSRKQRHNSAPVSAANKALLHLPIGLRNSPGGTRLIANVTSPYAINLRPRRTPTVGSETASVAVNTAPTSVTKLNPVMDRNQMKKQNYESRNLRSLNTKGQVRKKNNSRRRRRRAQPCSSSESTACMASFSKTTRLQSMSASSLAVPPPSPKLISAAKRAPRSLLAQSVPVSGVSSVCNKRSTLRSSSLNNTDVAVAVTIPSSFTLQTRSRGQKSMSH